MRNVIGDFKDNIIAKYDLKGSTANRKSNFDMEKSDSSTMKDLNFNEYEHGIMINRENIRKFRKITKADSSFLCRLELMDYSVFLVKLTLSKNEIIDIKESVVFVNAFLVVDAVLLLQLIYDERFRDKLQHILLTKPPQ